MAPRSAAWAASEATAARRAQRVVTAARGATHRLRRAPVWARSVETAATAVSARQVATVAPAVRAPARPEGCAAAPGVPGSTGERHRSVTHLFLMAYLSGWAVESL